MFDKLFEYTFIGGLREDYCITHDDQVHSHVIGGNAVYSAVGARIWDADVSVISRVGVNYPPEWIRDLEKVGIDTSGVRILPMEQDTRTFYAYISSEERIDTNPASHFLRIGETLPKALIDYQSSTEHQEDRTTFSPLAVRPEDLPPHMETVKAVHLAPADYLSHRVLPLTCRDLGIETVTLDPSRRYMDPSFRDELPELINGLTAFLPSEAEARSFFQPDTLSVQDMAKTFSEMGCPIIVIKHGARGQFVWEASDQKSWWIPAYPARVKDVTGAGDAFCGGFLVGLTQTGDVVEGAIHGSVSASLVIEGFGALFALESAPGLAHARSESLRTAVFES